VGAHEIQHLVREYGCLLVFLAVALQAFCLPVPGTTALVAAALYAASGHGPPIAEVIAAGVLGALVGTTVAFVVGRWGGERFLLRLGGRLRQQPERVQQLRHVFATRGTVWVFVGRFITGIRNVSGLLAGATGMPVGRFVAVSAAAALTWACFHALEYYWFGHLLLGASTWVQVVMVCAGLVWLLVSLTVLRRRALGHLRALTPSPDSGGSL
jgi:membrane protein DedA with SNARE-associated domain